MTSIKSRTERTPRRRALARAGAAVAASGTAAGALLRQPYGQANYTNENFPNSTQTQVTGLNNQGDTSGFWVQAPRRRRDFSSVLNQQCPVAEPAVPR
jgi:hypothetical protein